MNSFFISSYSGRSIAPNDLFMYSQNLRTLKNHYLSVLNTISDIKPILLAYSEKKTGLNNEIANNSLLLSLFSNISYSGLSLNDITELQEQIRKANNAILAGKSSLQDLDYLGMSAQDVKVIEQEQVSRPRKRHLKYYTDAHLLYRTYNMILEHYTTELKRVKTELRHISSYTKYTHL